MPGVGATGELRLVVLDDGRSLRIDAEEMARYGLMPGEPIDEALLARLEARDKYLRAREVAMRLLVLRPRSTAELRTRLRQRRVPPDQVQAVLADLTAAGYLDDRAFARAWVTGRIATRPCGVLRLRWELQEKGLPKALIEQAIREVLGEEDLAAAEERYARALLARRAATLSRLPSQTRRRRLAGFLERRGFASGTIARLLGTMERYDPAEITDGHSGE